MQGDESPDGTATFQSRLVPAPNSQGGWSFAAIPDAFGPRNCGHDAVEARRLKQAPRIENVNMRFMVRGVNWKANFPSRPAQNFAPHSPRSIPKFVGAVWSAGFSPLRRREVQRAGEFQARIAVPTAKRRERRAPSPTNSWMRHTRLVYCRRIAAHSAAVRTAALDHNLTRKVVALA